MSYLFDTMVMFAARKKGKRKKLFDPKQLPRSNIDIGKLDYEEQYVDVRSMPYIDIEREIRMKMEENENETLT